MPTAGVQQTFGKLKVASDTVAADIDEWNAEAAGTICEIHSVHVSARGSAAASEFSIQNADNDFLIQALPFVNGQPIDINDTANNQGVWVITRNGRRGTLNVTPALTFVDDPIVTGTQVSRVLQAGAAVVSAPESDVPPWARTGQESSRRIV